MNYLLYIFTYSLIWLLNLMPEWILFRISDVFYMLLYHVVGYRRKVVFDNLRMAFPEYEKKQIRHTARKFYRHFADLMLESAICHFYSETKAFSRISYRNTELLDRLYARGKMVMAVTAHYGNWEYMNNLELVSDYPVIGIYKPLKIRQFDNMIKRNRTRYGSSVTPMEKIARVLIKRKQENNPALTINLADQRPLFRQIQYWTKFMGLDTPLYLGTEKLARKLDAAVVFLKVRKVKRGRYEVEIELISEDPNSLEPFELTNRHVRILEELIREEPQYWLWSHRRWKHSYERYLAEKKVKS